MTELQQKILYYISKGYEAKEIAPIVQRGFELVKHDLRLLRIEFGAKNTIELIDILYRRGIMQQINIIYESN